MSLTYTQIIGLTGNQSYLAQMATALVKQAMSRVTTATGNELSLCAAIIKAPSGYAQRFLLDALIVNAAGLTSTNGTTLDTPPTDAAIDSVVAAQWAAQVLAGA